MIDDIIYYSTQSDFISHKNNSHNNYLDFVFQTEAQIYEIYEIYLNIRYLKFQFVNLSYKKPRKHLFITIITHFVMIIKITLFITARIVQQNIHLNLFLFNKIKALGKILKYNIFEQVSPLFDTKSFAFLAFLLIFAELQVLCTKKSLLYVYSVKITYIEFQPSIGT